MPRHKGKKKKGKIIKPGMQNTMEKAFVAKVDEKLGAMGLAGIMDMKKNLEVPQAAATDNDGNSAMDTSQYTYYSESVMNKSQMQDEEHDGAAAMMESPDVQNIRADLEAADLKEESKNVPKTTKNESDKQIFSQRSQRAQKTISFDAGEAEKSKSKVKTARGSPIRKLEQMDVEGTTQHATADDQSTPNAPENLTADQTSDDKASANVKPASGNEVLHSEGAVNDEKVKEAEVVAQVEEKKEASEGEECAQVDVDFLDKLEAAFGEENDVVLEQKAPQKEEKKAEVSPVVEAVSEEKPEEEKPVEKPVEKVQSAKEENKSEQDEPIQVDGAYFDDFEEAFGGPEVIITKKPKKANDDTPKVELKAEAPIEEKQVIEVKQETKEEKPESPAPQAKPEVKPVTETPKPVVAKKEASAEKDKSNNETHKASAMLGPQMNASQDISTKSEAKPLMMQSSETLASTAPTQSFSIKPIAAQAPEPVSAPKKVVTPVVCVETPQPVQITATPTPVQSDTKKSVNQETLSPAVKQKQPAKAPTPQKLAAPEEEEIKVEADQDDDSEAEQETPSGGGGYGLLLTGLVAAAAAGTFWYAKKNNIPVGDLLKQVQEKIQDRFRGQ